MQVSVVLEIRAFYIRAHARRQVISTSFLGLGEGPGVLKKVPLQGRKQGARRSYFKYTKTIEKLTYGWDDTHFTKDVLLVVDPQREGGGGHYEPLVRRDFFLKRKKLTK